MSTVRLAVQPIDLTFSLKDRVYDALKETIAGMNIYEGPDEPRLDERQLCKDLGVSRTPVREAIARLEQEGLVRVVPRRGVFVARKKKSEILELITVWAALESMAARLITEKATDEEIASLRALFATIEDDTARANIDEYSAMNIRFHQSIIRLSKSQLMESMTETLFIHMRAIRARTIGEDNRVQRSIIDHMNIIRALGDRDADLAERLTREHTLGLAAHVERNVTYLD
ncbi:MAG TPA: GntR family transcriptional regulator [Thermomicrobiales bacterium]|nr:GntR family transcriptional regulator [Thermomicrobiales bacterium]